MSDNPEQDKDREGPNFIEQRYELLKRKREKAQNVHYTNGIVMFVEDKEIEREFMKLLSRQEKTVLRDRAGDIDIDTPADGRQKGAHGLKRSDAEESKTGREQRGRAGAGAASANSRNTKKYRSKKRRLEQAGVEEQPESDSETNEMCLELEESAVMQDHSDVHSDMIFVEQELDPDSQAQAQAQVGTGVPSTKTSTKKRDQSENTENLEEEEQVFLA